MKRYRPNVCAVVTDADHAQVLVFRRIDGILGKDRWQFPQGGLDGDESPEKGLLRELREEIGTDAVEILRRAPGTIRYDFPAEVLAKLVRLSPEKQGYDGQEQHWFLVRLLGGTESLHFEHDPAEFDAFRWVAPEEALCLTVAFKRAAYQAGLTALGVLRE